MTVLGDHLGYRDESQVSYVKGKCPTNCAVGLVLILPFFVLVPQHTQNCFGVIGAGRTWHSAGVHVGLGMETGFLHMKHGPWSGEQ